MLRVGFLSSQNYLSRRTFSGTLFAMHEALRRQPIKLIDLGWPLRPGFALRLRRRLGACKPVAPDDLKRARRFATIVEWQLRLRRCDVLFAPVASSCLAQLRTSLPIVYTSDTTFSLYRQTYEMRFDAHAQECIERNERAAIGKATRLLYPSRWAAASAVTDYGADPAIVDVATYGANMREVPDPNCAAQRVRTLGQGRCRILFVGVDFKRKGGPIALQALRVLRARGVDAELTIVGTKPPDGTPVDGVNVIPFINKDIPAQAERLHRLYINSHFMIFPTRADCSPIVLCEAAAYGLPVVSSDVGGIPDIVLDGRNGALLSAAAPAEEYADHIAALWADADRYRMLVTSARGAYDERLNWNAWGAAAVRSLSAAAATTSG